jgi:hypothetical protein
MSSSQEVKKSIIREEAQRTQGNGRNKKSIIKLIKWKIMLKYRR